MIAPENNADEITPLQAWEKKNGTYGWFDLRLRMIVEKWIIMGMF